MDVTEFRSLILDERLRVLFDYWQRIRSGRQMPDWAEIRPEEFAAALPHTWVWQLDALGDLRLRIIGESVMQIMELNLKGKGPFDLYAPEQAEPIVERLTRVMNEPSCSFALGEVYSGGQLIGVGQRLGLPYFDRRVGRLGVIGASILDKRIKTSSDLGTAIYNLTGNERYLSLA
jgi:PAS domain